MFITFDGILSFTYMNDDDNNYNNENKFIGIKHQKNKRKITQIKENSEDVEQLFKQCSSIIFHFNYLLKERKIEREKKKRNAVILIRNDGNNLKILIVMKKKER